MDLKDLKTYTDKLEPRDIQMFHHCLRKEWTRLSDFQESIESGFKSHEAPTKQFRSNVHNRTQLLLNEIKAELQYMENLLHYSEEFFNYPKTQEYHWYIDTPEKGTSHINNTI